MVDRTATGPGGAVVLVVEDDGAVRRALERALTLHGFRVHAVGDGLTALRALATVRPDVILLDIGLPGPDGLRLTDRLRGDGVMVPILMLTARDAVRDRVAGLAAGADDYLVKPFALEELVARLNALLRRGREPRRAPDAAPERPLRFADLVLDVAGHVARRGEREVPLSPTEFQILAVLMTPAGRVATRQRILDEVWDGQDVGANALEQHVAGLRRRLEERGEPRLLQTVRGIGYVLRTTDGEGGGR